MSREVRRVPVEWKHPTEPNPYWREQTISLLNRGRSLPKMHRPEVMFTPLYGTPFSEAHAEWERERALWEAGEHDSLLFSLCYHSADGYVNRKGERETPRPYVVYADDGETVVREFYPATVAELLEVYPYSDYASEPTPQTHMPDFPEGTATGWALYETVSEGTPVTPTFATADGLVEHLATVGTEWDDEPWRRTAAERIVEAGHSMGSMVYAGGKLYNGAKDIDIIPGALS